MIQFDYRLPLQDGQPGEWLSLIGTDSVTMLDDIKKIVAKSPGLHFRMSCSSELAPAMLYLLRELRGKTENQVGAAVWHSEKDSHLISMVSRIESGERKLGMKTLEQFSVALECELAIQLTGKL